MSSQMIKINIFVFYISIQIILVQLKQGMLFLVFVQGESGIFNYPKFLQW